MLKKVATFVTTTFVKRGEGGGGLVGIIYILFIYLLLYYSPLPLPHPTNTSLTNTASFLSRINDLHDLLNVKANECSYFHQENQ